MTDTDNGVARRDFLVAGATTLMLTSAGTTTAAAQDNPATNPELRSAPVLVGPSDARPAPGDDFFDNKTRYGYVYQPTDDATKWVITDEMQDWADLASSGIWTDTTGDGLAELPNHDGTSVHRRAYTDTNGAIKRELTYDDATGELVVIHHD